jgi:hypothetical protein
MRTKRFATSAVGARGTLLSATAGERHRGQEQRRRSAVSYGHPQPTSLRLGVASRAQRSDGERQPRLISRAPRRATSKTSAISEARSRRPRVACFRRSTVRSPNDRDEDQNAYDVGARTRRRGRKVLGLSCPTWTQATRCSHRTIRRCRRCSARSGRTRLARRSRPPRCTNACRFRLARICTAGNPAWFRWRQSSCDRRRT